MEGNMKGAGRRRRRRRRRKQLLIDIKGKEDIGT